MDASADPFSRVRLLMGARAVETFARVRVAVFGLGGVGGWCAEALVRSGVGGLMLVDDDRVEPKKAMLEAYPELRRMYDPEDGNTEVLYFKNAKATFSSFTAAPETVEF